ncbi:MAG: hypothetical protein ABIG43_00825 [Chloroflexota bacterium]
MSHQPYEKWLLSEDIISQQENESLKIHLQECKACQDLHRAWQAVEKKLTVNAQLEPQSGFARRWEIRLEKSREAKRQKRITVSIGIILVFSLLATWSTLLTGLTNFSLPYFLGNLFATLGHFIARATHFLRGFESLFRVFPLAIPISAAIGVSLMAVVTLLLAFWTVSLFKIYQPEQGVTLK